MDIASKLLHIAGVGSGGESLSHLSDMFESVVVSVKEHMSAYDASHDFDHVLRVTALARIIFRAEIDSKGAPDYDLTTVLLAALLHDVTDKKYSSGSASHESKLDIILEQAGVSPDLCAKIIEVVNHVSYSSEIRNPQQTKQVLSKHPELGIVQDADRLDAIGAVGIGRTFTFGGAKMPQSSMQLSRDHLSDKLENLEAMMKTNTGRRMARERTERIKMFAAWWDEESEVISAEGIDMKTPRSSL